MKSGISANRHLVLHIGTRFILWLFEWNNFHNSFQIHILRGWKFNTYLWYNQNMLEALSNLINANIESTMYKMFCVFVDSFHCIRKIYLCENVLFKMVVETNFHPSTHRFIKIYSIWFHSKRCIMLMDVCIFIFMLEFNFK